MHVLKRHLGWREATTLQCTLFKVRIKGMRCAFKTSLQIKDISEHSLVKLQQINHSRAACAQREICTLL